MAQPSKKQRTHPQYELLYHPGIPGRGEFVRLAFEAAGVAYTDIANEQKDGYNTVQQICMNKGTESADGNPPVFSPPALKVPRAGPDGHGSLIIHQTPAILFYLGDKLGLVPEDEAGRFHVSQVALTALDLNNEVHDTHHPVAVAKYYEEQKEESLKKARDVRESRIPKFLSYFQQTLKHNQSAGQGKYLVGDRLTYADTTVWQVLDGCMFAFPKEMGVRKEEYPDLLRKFYENMTQEAGLKEYLNSHRRQAYSMGVYRYYPELDRQ